MKKLWGRIGVEIELGDDEFEALISEDGEGLRELIRNHFGEESWIQLSGETYFPAANDCSDSFGTQYDNPKKQELNFEF